MDSIYSFETWASLALLLAGVGCALTLALKERWTAKVTQSPDTPIEPRSYVQPGLSTFDDMALAASDDRHLVCTVNNEVAAAKPAPDNSRTQLDPLNAVRVRANAFRLSENIWKNPALLREMIQIDPQSAQVLDQFRRSVEGLQAGQRQFAPILVSTTMDGIETLDAPEAIYLSARLTDAAPLAEDEDIGRLVEERRRVRLAQPSSLSSTRV